MNRIDGVAVLTRLATLFAKYPPHASDYPILFRLRALGLEPGKPFDASKLDPATVAAINAAGKGALEDIAPSLRKIGKLVNGWNLLTENIGTYGTSDKQRALLTRGGLGANLRRTSSTRTTFSPTGSPTSTVDSYHQRTE